LLQAHISLYALGIVALYAINLIRNPDDVWADRWILAWTVLVLIHAVVVGLLWAVRQWNADEPPDEPLLMTRRAPGPAWAMPPAESANAQEARFRVNDDRPEPVQAAPWSDWSGEMPGPEIPESERASWSEAAAAAWLDRTGQLTPPSDDTDETSKSE
jgi:hypothetical protein